MIRIFPFAAVLVTLAGTAAAADPPAKTGVLPRVVTTCELTGPTGAIPDTLRVVGVGVFGESVVEAFPLASTTATYDGVAGLLAVAPAWVKDHPASRYSSAFGSVAFMSAQAAKAAKLTCPCEAGTCPCRATGECTCYGKCACGDCPGRKKGVTAGPAPVGSPPTAKHVWRKAWPAHVGSFGGWGWAEPGFDGSAASPTIPGVQRYVQSCSGGKCQLVPVP